MLKFLKNNKIFVGFIVLLLLLLIPVQDVGCPNGGFCAYQENGEIKYPENPNKIPLALHFYEVLSGNDTGFHY